MKRSPAAIWYEVRDRLNPFTNAAPLHIEDRDLGPLAQRAHSGLRNEFGQVDLPRVMAPDGTGIKVAAVGYLQAMVNGIPAIADHLATAVQRLADHGELYALAARLPFREQRVEQFLNRRAVVGDRFDVVTVMDRLGDAAKLAAELATTLDQASGSTISTCQPDLVAANADRAAVARPGPRAALVQQVSDGIGPAGAATDDVRMDADWAGAVDEGGQQASPDWDMH